MCRSSPGEGSLRRKTKKGGGAQKPFPFDSGSGSAAGPPPQTVELGTGGFVEGRKSLLVQITSWGGKGGALGKKKTGSRRSLFFFFGRRGGRKKSRQRAEGWDPSEKTEGTREDLKTRGNSQRTVVKQPTVSRKKGGSSSRVTTLRGTLGLEKNSSRGPRNLQESSYPKVTKLTEEPGWGSQNN